MVYGESVLTLTEEQMMKRYLEQSPDMAKIHIQEQLLKKQHKETLDAYQKAKDQARSAKARLRSAEDSRNYYEKEYLNTSTGSQAEEVAFQEFHWSLHTYDGTKKAYQQALKQEGNLLKASEQLVLQVEQAEHKRKQDLAQLKSNFQKDCWDLLLLEKQKELLEKNKQLLQQRLQVEKVKKDLNLTTERAIEQLENQLQEVNVQLKTMDMQIHMAYDNLKRKLDIPLEQEVTFVLSLPQTYGARVKGVSDLVKKFKENSLQFKMIQRNQEIQEEYEKKIQEAYKEEDSEYQVATLETEQINLETKDQAYQMEQGVRQLYDQYKKALESLYHSIEAYELAEKQWREMTLRYEWGQISQLQYEQQAYALKQAQYQKMQQTIGYMKLKEAVELAAQGILQ